MACNEREGMVAEQRPLLAVTMGDPAGVGPELCLHLLERPEILDCCVPLIVGDADVLVRVADVCGRMLPRCILSLAEWNGGTTPTEPAILDCATLNAGDVCPGEVTAQSGRAAAAYIETAVGAAMQKRVIAVATAPIHKEALHLAGVAYPGHTEMLAALTGCRRTCMTMASEAFVVSLVTTHVSYAEVPRLLATERIVEVINLSAEAMNRIHGRPPRMVVCALNPHGGEHGLFGDEEERIIVPAIEIASLQGHDVSGPLPPDTAFLEHVRRQTDVYIVMYHDQGLIPFKMLAFDQGVNVTLGLPIVRTSPDHGTAFDIAWKGMASPNSMMQSVLWAVRLAGLPSASGANP